MIEISRSLVRQIRNVFRKLAPRMSAFQPLVAFQASKDGLHVRLHRAEVLAQYHLAGELAPEEIVLSLNALADFEGKTQVPVVLDAVEPGSVQARWEDSGVPQVMSYPVEDPAQLLAHPSFPEKMASVETGFMEALAEATRSADREAIRYAVNHIQLKGTGAIVATDGRQLLVQRALSFPWKEDVLVPASAAYGCREVLQHPVAIGKSDTHVTVQAGAWTLHLPIDKEGRFPDVARVIPRKDAATTHCRLAVEDRKFLARSLPRLPGGGDENAPVTLDLNGQVCVRARAEGQEQIVEVALARSEATGKSVRLVMNRNYLDRALQLGLEELYVQAADTPLLFQDEKRQFVVVPLNGQNSLSASAKSIRISSTQDSVTDGETKPQRRNKTVNDLNNHVEPGTNGNDGATGATAAQAQPAINARRSRKSKATGLAALIEEVEALKDALRDAFSRSHKLVSAIKRQRKHSRLMQSTLASLRQLQHIES